MLRKKIIEYAEKQGLIIGFCSYETYKEMNTSSLTSDKIAFAKTII